MRSSLLDKQLMAAQEVTEAREALRVKIDEFRKLTKGRGHVRAPSMRQLSDLAIGPSSSARTRKNRRKAKKAAEESLVVLPTRQTVAHKRILDVIEKNEGKASLSDIRNYPGVSVKNLSRLLKGMMDKGLIKTTYGGKYKVSTLVANGIN